MFAFYVMPLFVMVRSADQREDLNLFKDPQVVDMSPEHFSFHRYNTLNE